MEFKYLVNKESKRATFRLYGGIGTKLDGDFLAQEIAYVDTQVEEILLLINSEGGSIFQGLSILSALKNCKSFVTVKIDGVAASMAGVIAMGADLIQMNNYARLMVHNPTIQGKKTLSKKDVKAIDAMKGILTGVFEAKGIDSEQMAELMDKETWLTAKEALDIGLIDEIIDTKKAPQVAENLSPVELVAAFEPFLQPDIKPKNNKVMNEELINALELGNDANEIQAVEAVNQIVADRETAKTKVTNLEDQLKESQRKTAEILVDQAIAVGKISKDARDSFINMGAENISQLETVLAGVKAPVISIVNQLNSEDKNAPVKDYAWYQENAPDALLNIMKSEPEAFQKLVDGYEGK